MRNQTQLPLSDTEIDALLVTGAADSGHLDQSRRLEPMHGIVLAVGAGSLLWALVAWAVLAYLR